MQQGVVTTEHGKTEHPKVEVINKPIEPKVETEPTKVEPKVTTEHKPEKQHLMSHHHLRSLQIYLVACSIVFPLVALGNHFMNYDPTLKLLVYLACSAGMGCTVYSNLCMVKHVSENSQLASFFSWYLFRPFIAIPLGIFVYFMVAGGLLVLGNVSIPENDTQRMMFLYSVAFLAGFAIDSMINKMYEIVHVLFSSADKNKNSPAAGILPATSDNNGSAVPAGNNNAGASE